MANSKESYREDGKADALAGKPPRYEKRGSWQSLAYLESYDAAITSTETKRESSNCGNETCTGCSTTLPRVRMPIINKATGAVGEIILPKATVDKLVGLSKNFKVLKSRPAKRPIGGLEYEEMKYSRCVNTVNALRSHIRSLQKKLTEHMPVDKYERLHKSLDMAQQKLLVANVELNASLRFYNAPPSGAIYRASESA